MIWSLDMYQNMILNIIGSSLIYDFMHKGVISSFTWIVFVVSGGKVSFSIGENNW